MEGHSRTLKISKFCQRIWSLRVWERLKAKKHPCNTQKLPCNDKLVYKWIENRAFLPLLDHLRSENGVKNRCKESFLLCKDKKQPFLAKNIVARKLFLLQGWSFRCKEVFLPGGCFEVFVPNQLRE
jgi:hypothetical protein